MLRARAHRREHGGAASFRFSKGSDSTTSMGCGHNLVAAKNHDPSPLGLGTTVKAVPQPRHDEPGLAEP
nr:unnamed protein product [Digitaria exilis]